VAAEDAASILHRLLKETRRDGSQEVVMRATREKKTRALLVCAPALALLLGAPAIASAGLTPGELVKRSLDRMALRARGATMTMVMKLVEKGGAEQTRTMHARAQKVGDRTHSLMRFLAPSEVAGTAFLFIQEPGRTDQQYMYLPALRAVRRIAGRQREGRFMGSDFSYADLEWRDLQEASYQRASDEAIGAHSCHVIDSIPTGESQYGRVRAWIRKSDLVPLRFKFYDRRSQLEKTLFVRAIKQVQGKPMVTELKMASASGHATVLQLQSISLRDDLPAHEVSLRALRNR
jgi:hypothetical protein